MQRVKRVLPYVALAVFTFALFHSRDVKAYPQPSASPVSWQLDFQAGTPTRITVKVPGSDAPKAYCVGTIQLRCYVVGTTTEGVVAGLATTSIET